MWWESSEDKLGSQALTITTVSWTIFRLAAELTILLKAVDTEGIDAFEQKSNQLEYPLTSMTTYDTVCSSYSMFAPCTVTCRDVRHCTVHQLNHLVQPVRLGAVITEISRRTQTQE
jgi:hypothetical protein